MSKRDTRTAGESTCPLCGRHWLVTPYEDCMLPECGCFGFETGATALYRPCHPCGVLHSLACPHMPGRERRSTTR